MHDGSFYDILDFVQGFVGLLLGLGEFTVGRFLVGGEDPGSDVALIGNAAGGVDLLQETGGGNGLGVEGSPPPVADLRPTAGARKIVGWDTSMISAIAS